MEYKERIYRGWMKGERWQSFTVAYRETDLWVGVNRGKGERIEAGEREGEIEGEMEEMKTFAYQVARDTREEMERYLAKDPGYARALTPYTAGIDAPGILQEMAEASRRAGTGPMSAVAGAVARRVGEALRVRFGTREVVVENGGDIYAEVEEPMEVAVFAGASPLSGRVGLEVPAGRWGICTSSGTVGPSLSFGKADAVMVVCRDCALADAYATAFANRVQRVEDIPGCVALMERQGDIAGAICIKDDRMGMFGEFPLKLFEV